MYGEAPITQIANVRNKNSNGKRDFPHHKELLLKERIHSI